MSALVFAPQLAARAIPGRGLVVGGEHGTDIYSGAAMADVGARIDGRIDRESLLGAIGDADREAAGAALDELLEASVVIELADERPVRDAAWWQSLGVSPRAAEDKLRAATVSLSALGAADDGPLRSGLAQAGVRIVDESATLAIVLAEDYLAPELAEFNERALDAGHPWLLARPGRATVLVGPLFVPESGPCWECMAQRLRLRGRLAADDQSSGVREVALGPRPPALAAELAAGLVLTDALRWLAGESRALEGVLRSFDSRTWSSGHHVVVWRPQCPACGGGLLPGEEPPAARAIPMSLPPSDAPVPDAPDAARAEFREAAPSATYRRLSHHLSALTGAVAMLERRPGAEFLHAYLAGGPVARIHGESAGWEAAAGMYSGGKGTTDDAARTGALCEALERYSGAFTGDEPRRIARAEELAGAAILPNVHMNFSERQYAERAAWNERAKRSFKLRVPEPFNPDDPIAWSPAWSLTYDAERWMPTALSFYGVRLPGEAACVGESNGNAAGGTLTEAIVHGGLELIERDHVAIWWYNRLRRPAVDLDAVGDPWLDRVRAHVRTLGRELWVLDLTADLGIPVAAAVSCAADGSDVRLGFGAHLALGAASVRAVTELVQLGLGAPSGGLGTGPGAAVRASGDSFLRPDPALSAPRADETAPAHNAAEALTRLRAPLEREGLELIVLDQTRPDIELPVVKVIVPGLRHFWPRLGPGRLYDVPAELGWLPAPLAEGDLNPEPPAV